MTDDFNKKQQVIKKLLDGKPMSEVEEEEGLSHRTVLRWYKDFQSGTLEVANLTNKASTRYQRLSAGQVKWFDLVMRTKAPSDFSLNKSLWDRNLTHKLLQTWCKQSFPNNETYTLLEELGFVLPNPVEAAFQSQNKKLKNWMVTKWPKISDEYTDKGYRILWLDSAPLSGDFKVVDDKVSGAGAYVIRKSTSTQTAAVTFAYYPVQRRFYFIAVPCPPTEANAIDFLARLEQDHPRPCLLVVSKESVFNSPAVVKHVKNYSSNFKLLATP